MIKAGKWIAKHKKLILFIGLVLLAPSVFGFHEKNTLIKRRTGKKE